MTEQKSISSAVFGLQDSLRSLEQKFTCLQPKSADAKGDIKRKPNELHALGTVNLDKAREEFSNQINIIRNVCSQFETEVLGDVMKMGVGADPAFRKHFTHLKEQATLESTVLRVKDTLRNTKEFFEKTMKEKEESKSKIETQRLEKLAQSMGLVTFVDSTQKLESEVPVTTITLGGTVIVVDIDIDDTGRVSRTKVTYVSDTLQNDQDDRVDLMLADNLQHRQVDLFKRNLSSLALMDQLNVKYNPIDFFSVTKHLLYDLQSICRQEMSMESDPSIVLLEGHGIPSLHLQYPGISIAYWMNRQDVIDSHWSEIKSSFEQGQNHPSLSNTFRLLVSFEDSIQPMCYLPASKPNYLMKKEDTEESITEGPNGQHFKIVTETTAPKFMPHLRFIKPLSTHPETQPVPIRFVVTLDPPVPVSDEICQKLMNVTGLLNLDLVPDVPYNPSSASLEDMLVMDVEQAVLSKPNWISSFEGAPDQIYKWTASSPTSAKMISRVPFHHPVQIYNILQCLRQQQMFNTLFTSIFNTNTYKKRDYNTSVSLSLKDILSESQKDDSSRIEITTIDAPNSLYITLSPAPLPNQATIMIPLSIDIPVDQPTKPNVRLHAPSLTHQRWNPQVFDETKMTDQLQNTHDVPAFIHWLSQKMRSADACLIDRNKRAFPEEDDFSATEIKQMKMELDE